jgi:hypothetical protein
MYKQKLHLLENFKILNSRVTNSIYYLYDMRVEDRKKQELLDHIFFIIGQILMDLPYDQRKLSIDMNTLKSYSKEHQIFSYFYQHSK